MAGLAVTRVGISLWNPDPGVRIPERPSDCPVCGLSDSVPCDEPTSWIDGLNRAAGIRLEIIAKHPARNFHQTPLLFIHGMLHGAWCWDVHFLDCFAQRGCAAHAVSLRGHGESDGRDRLRWTRIADYVEDGANAVCQRPSPPILIGHSMGGFVIQKYLEGHDCPGAALLSSPPPAELLGTTVRIARRLPLVSRKPTSRSACYP